MVNLSNEALAKQAIEAVEQDGIVFIDEIDKICSSPDMRRNSGDASAEGVQRDLLPIVEGTTVSTKHGNVQVIDTSLFSLSLSFCWQ